MGLVEALPFSRKYSSWQERRAFLSKILQLSAGEIEDILSCPCSQIAQNLIESAVGYFCVPLGIVWRLPVNGRFYHIPLATEEASVLAAANYAAKILQEVGIYSEVSDSLLSGQIYLKTDKELFETFWWTNRVLWESKIQSYTASMSRRGGGYLSSSLRYLDELGILVWDIVLNVYDAQGANTLNGLLENLGEWLEEHGFQTTLKILSNNLDHVPSQASFCLPLENLRQLGYTPQVIEKLLLNSQIALLDPLRALTHNKGIMNGVTALALATGNDTRALEAAVHAYSARLGKIQALSWYTQEAGFLKAHIQMPLALASVGGITKVHPTARLAFKILGVESAKELKEVAIALGLAQNLAALLALSSTGIQKGHMELHKRKDIITDKKL